MNITLRECLVTLVVIFGFGLLTGATVFGSPQLACSIDWTALAAIGTVAAFCGVIGVHLREQKERRFQALELDRRRSFSASISMHVDAIHFEITVFDLLTCITRREFPGNRSDTEIKDELCRCIKIPKSFREATIASETLPYFRDFRYVLFFSASITNMARYQGMNGIDWVQIKAALLALLTATEYVVDGIEKLTDLQAQSSLRIAGNARERIGSLDDVPFHPYERPMQ